MQITWTDANGRGQSGPVPDSVRVYVDRVGIEAAVALLLSFGGSVVCFPKSRPGADGPLVSTIGLDAALALGDEFKGGSARVPTASKFIARYLRGQGQSIDMIARSVRRSDVAVRRYLKGADETESAACPKRRPARAPAWGSRKRNS